MEDRFKLRAWDTEEDRYASDDDICYDTGGTCDSVYDLLNADDQFYIYEQCTGLKDKNGKLIYEGDIVRAIYSDGITEFGLPIYHNRQGGFSVGFYNSDAGWLDEDFVGKVEVIGNIHENPELLEEK